MKFSVFNSIPYGPVHGSTSNWPVPNELYQPGAGALAFDQRIDGDGGAVDQVTDRCRVDAAFFDAVDDALGKIMRCRQTLRMVEA